MRGSGEFAADVDGLDILSNIDERRGRSQPDTNGRVDRHMGEFVTTSARMSPYLDSTSSDPSPQRVETPKMADIQPPMRPKSTPFSYLDRRTPSPERTDPFDVTMASLSGDGDDGDSTTTLFEYPERSEPITHFSDLPIEVHEAILDYLFGYRVSTTSRSSMQVSNPAAMNLSTALRHCRRRELTKLALVSSAWRDLVQQRLYRHVKLKATLDFLEEAMEHFAKHPHLQTYVKHLEIWFPVFQPTYTSWTKSNALTLPTVTMDGLTNATYTLPCNNCTLEEVFTFVQQALPSVRILTLEGGERRKAPKVVHFGQHSAGSSCARLPSITSVQTLITRGQWNLMRDNCDFATVFAAFPNLTRWNGSYSKPKSKTYISMSDFLPYLNNISVNLKSLDLCLESDYRREPALPHFFFKAALKTHTCARLAETLPALEHFSFTGRICNGFFDAAFRNIDPRSTKLKSIDLTVKNCCRDVINWHDSGSGIQDMGFIEAFEKLVVSGIRTLAKFNQLQYMRIRFVDLGRFPLNFSFRGCC